MCKLISQCCVQGFVIRKPILRHYGLQKSVMRTEISKVALQTNRCKICGVVGFRIEGKIQEGIDVDGDSQERGWFHDNIVPEEKEHVSKGQRWGPIGT